MKRRSIWVAPTLICLLASSFSTGCATLFQGLRSKERDTPPSESTDSDDPDSGAGKKFFKPSRLSGAWSSEGREIERDLGIH
jgi:hypothetical protein